MADSLFKNISRIKEGKKILERTDEVFHIRQFFLAIMSLPGHTGVETMSLFLCDQLMSSCKLCASFAHVQSCDNHVFRKSGISRDTG